MKQHYRTWCITAVASVLAFAATAYADVREESGVTITGIVVSQDGGFYIETNRALCTGAGNTRGFARAGVNGGGYTWTQDGADMMLSIAQMALVSNRTVRVFTDDNNDLDGSGNNRWGCLMHRIALQ